MPLRARPLLALLAAHLVVHIVVDVVLMIQHAVHAFWLVTSTTPSVPDFNEEGRHAPLAHSGLQRRK
ncbi:hypothetical protein GGX14DRAFT_575685 [Mycena pura]|uniref:Uncharacterized protein n=1 Tax=Mycena pura TaxID=153505 RepID=A0AAD6UZ35_9AGAR|nr:hypothetical protein GGX14DRAFT_575685 [Mycena pura]